METLYLSGDSNHERKRMNWYKIAQSLEDLFKKGDGRLRFPLPLVIKAPGKPEWHLDLKLHRDKLTLGGSPARIEDVSVGDEIFDTNLHTMKEEASPYWRVEWVAGRELKLTVVPLEGNPVMSGVGAGGHQLGDFDYLVQSGGFEEEAIDRVLSLISKKEYHSPSDVKYILLGTVPMRFGANGAEGGWYNADDLGASRGGMRGMTSSEMMIKDALSLSKMGFTLPNGARDGSMRPGDWNGFVNSGIISNSGVEGGPQSLEETARAVIVEKNPQLRTYYFEQLVKNTEPENKALILDTIRSISREPSPRFDRNYILKENAIWWAMKMSAPELVKPFILSDEPDVQSSAICALLKVALINNDTAINLATHPKALYKTLSDIKGKNTLDTYIETIKKNREKINSILSKADAESVYWIDNIKKILKDLDAITPENYEFFRHYNS